jgi:F-type H+-transporting ATPase subunit gamma
MPKNSKAVKRRIASVKNTRKITKSMQMIAAAKMQKAVKAATAAKPYYGLALELIENLQSAVSNQHRLVKHREIETELLVVIASSRGLCGSFNINVINAASNWIRQTQAQHPERKIQLLVIGKRGAIVARRFGLELVGLYEKLSDTPHFDAAAPIADDIIKRFVEAEVDRVTVAFTNYESSLKQTPVVQQLLPLENLTHEAQSEKQSAETDDTEAEAGDEIVIEPAPARMLNYLLPKLAQVEFFQAILESTASEHSSRMIAMKNATDSAGEMIDYLTLEYNESRQAAITQEIAEIVNGAQAIN